MTYYQIQGEYMAHNGSANCWGVDPFYYEPPYTGKDTGTRYRRFSASIIEVYKATPLTTAEVMAAALLGRIDNSLLPDGYDES